VLGPAGGAARTAAEGPAGWAWFDALAAELEAASYAVAAADLPAAGIGAPHIRQRLFFGAIALEPGGLGHGFGAGSQGRLGMPGRSDQCAARPAGLAGGLADGDGGLARHGAIQRCRQYRCEPEDREAGRLVDRADPVGTTATDGVWRDPDWLLCRDGRWRPVEPGTFPLADGISGRMGLLRGYGNAIVPPLAAEFATAFMECLR
jgi:DNA (cytosine-5)-methyltransferase 1